MKEPANKPDPSNSLLEEGRTFWRETAKELIRSSIMPLDETAKQVIGVVTILEGLYFNAIAFSNLRSNVPHDWHIAVYLAPICLLLVSLVAALMVFFPKGYLLNIHSSEASRLVHEDLLKRKRHWLRIASIFLVLGIVALFFAVLLYLLG